MQTVYNVLKSEMLNLTLVLSLDMFMINANLLGDSYNVISYT